MLIRYPKSLLVPWEMKARRKYLHEAEWLEKDYPRGATTNIKKWWVTMQNPPCQPQKGIS